MVALSSRKSSRRFALMPLIGLAGCGTPAVVMSPLAAGDGANAQAAAIDAARQGSIPVALPVSRIVVSRARAEGATPAPTAGYRLNVVPTASTVQFRAAPYRDFVSRNVLAIRTAENSSVPISVGNTFTDQTVERINQIGSVIASVVRVAGRLAIAGGPSIESVRGAGGGGCGSAELPEFFIDVSDAQVVNGRTNRVPGPSSCFTWSLTRTPPAAVDGSIARADFVRMLAGPEGRRARFWPVPTCLPLRLTIRRTGTAADVISAAVTVADPDRVFLYPLPQDGTLAMHPVCGADLTDKPSDRWGTAFSALSAIDTQIQAVGKAANPSN